MGWQVGAIVAPLLGGVLASPAATWPSLFGSTIFERHPYALPCLVAGFIPGLAVPFAIYLLEETQPRLKSHITTGVTTFRTEEVHLGPSVRQTSFKAWVWKGCMAFGSKEKGLPTLWSCGGGFVLMLFVSLEFNSGLYRQMFSIVPHRLPGLGHPSQRATSLLFFCRNWRSWTKTGTDESLPVLAAMSSCPIRSQRIASTQQAIWIGEDLPWTHMPAASDVWRLSSAFHGR